MQIQRLTLSPAPVFARPATASAPDSVSLTRPDPQASLLLEGLSGQARTLGEGLTGGLPRAWQVRSLQAAEGSGAPNEVALRMLQSSLTGDRDEVELCAAFGGLLEAVRSFGPPSDPARSAQVDVTLESCGWFGSFTNKDCEKALARGTLRRIEELLTDWSLPAACASECQALLAPERSLAMGETADRVVVGGMMLPKR